MKKLHAASLPSRSVRIERSIFLASDSNALSMRFDLFLRLATWLTIDLLTFRRFATRA
ncbi:MAG TPA: hypothetical protein VGP89_06350 [Candidatus Angelobacter sp.]|nr:hypothetical protein [Candidatus Angelobacter sp.]